MVLIFLVKKIQAIQASQTCFQKPLKFKTRIRSNLFYNVHQIEKIRLDLVNCLQQTRNN
jgi:hypothetical protein